MPGAPPRASTAIPESSENAGRDVAFAAAWALIRAFSRKLVPVSSGSPMPSSTAATASTPNGASNSRISSSLPGLCVAITSRPVIRRCGSPLMQKSLQVLHHCHFLQIDELADALSGESQQRQQLGFGEWCLLRRGLNLDNAAASGENEIRVGVSAGILRVVQIEYRRTRANTTRYCGDVLAQWQGANDVPGFHPGEAIMQRHPAARYGGRSGAAVGLNDIAIDGYLALTKRFKIHDGAKAAANKPLDFNSAAALFAGSRFASCPFQGSARQHAIFGRNPAAGLALEPGRQAIFERRCHQHMGIAEFHKARAFCIFHDTAFERDGAQFIGLAAAWSHGFPPGGIGVGESCAATWLLGSPAMEDKAR